MLRELDEFEVVVIEDLDFVGSINEEYDLLKEDFFIVGMLDFMLLVFRECVLFIFGIFLLV